ncbi:hypothetical protein PALB_13950 [Pseudoalteromonas luteoviolacea B = ATCC 29581]|nr:hypothetical protein PALB_13950 [Pseudoalteromonas luteoviolacea B = ATCC 29581]
MKHEQSLQNQGMSSLLSIIKKTKPSTGLILLCVSLVIAQTGFSLLVPLQTKNLLDGISETQQYEFKALLLLGLILFVASAISGIQHYLLGKLGNEQKRILRNQLFRHLIHLPIRFYDKTLSGEPANRIVKDSEIIEELMSRHSASFLSGLVSLVGSFMILWFLDWRLTAVLFVAVSLSFTVIFPFAKKITGLSKSLQDQEAHFMATISEWFSQIRLIRSTNAEKKVSSLSANQVDSLFATSMSEMRLTSWMSPLINLAIMASIIAVLGFGANLVATNAMTIGTFVAFIMFLLNIVFPVMQLSFFFASLNKAAGAALRIEELLQEPQDRQGRQLHHQSDTTIEFNDVFFGYDQSKPILNGFNLTIKSNKTTALVATSGSGKSTIFSLLLGFYRVDSGSLRIGGTDLSELDKDHFLATMGYVSQDTPVLSGTLRSNLQLGLPNEPTIPQFNHALTQADLLDYVTSLEKGLDTIVGERGITLSGGQRQRLALARALLRAPKILLLDEVTASLDAHSESRIQTALDNAAQGRTTIVAAHRLSTVVNADEIVFIDKGRVIGTGTHNHLLQTLPAYRALVEKQMHQAAQKAVL